MTAALMPATPAPRRTIVCGVMWWNRAAVSALLSSDSEPPPAFARSVESALSQARDTGAHIVSWASRTTDSDRQNCSRHGITLEEIEDGFVRSVGLGAGLASGFAYVLDRRGIYYDARRPSDLEYLILNAELTEAEVARGARLRDRIIEMGLSKYNVGRRRSGRAFPLGRRGVLVPGQVAADASIARTLSCTIDSSRPTDVNLQLLRCARERHPTAYIVYKPHPDVAAGLRPGAIAREEALALADAVHEDHDIIGLIEQCDCVETLTSLTGFEALIRGREVAAHGTPFYAGWGLTEDLTVMPRRGRRRTIDELCALALIAYSRYVDPVIMRPCAAEQFIERIAALRHDAGHARRSRFRQHLSWLGRRAGL